MKVRQQRFFRWLGASSFCVAALIIAAGFLVPIPEPLTVAASARQVSTQSEKTTKPRKSFSKSIPLTEFEEATDCWLQRPLFDPPPPEPEPEPEVPRLPPPRVSLIMILSGETNRAMFRDAQGGLMYKTQGESITDSQSTAEVFEIHKDHVVLKHDDELIRLSLNAST